MKKRSLQISIIAVCLLATAPASESFGPPRARAQTDPWTDSLRNVWYATYSVTVKGEGTEEPPLGSGGPEISWGVNRVYSGKARLTTRMTQEELLRPVYHSDKGDPVKTDDPYYPTDYITFSDDAALLNIKVKDYITKKYDPQCEEYTVEEETWVAKVEDARPVGNPTLTTERGGKHHLYLPVLHYLTPPPHDLIYHKDTYHRPNGPNSPGQPQYGLVKSLRFPYVEDSLMSGAINILNHYPKIEAGEYTIDSGELLATRTMFERINTVGKVTIRIVVTVRKDSK